MILLMIDASLARISIRLGEVTCCGEVTPHRDVKTLRLGIRLHQRITNNLSIGSESSASTYPPVSGQSRCLSSLVVIGLCDWVVCGVDYVTRPEPEQRTLNRTSYPFFGRDGIEA
jgi:hypothetical protein